MRLASSVGSHCPSASSNDCCTSGGNRTHKTPDPKSGDFTYLPTKVFCRVCDHLSIGSSLMNPSVGVAQDGRGSTLK